MRLGAGTLVVGLAAVSFAILNAEPRVQSQTPPPPASQGATTPQTPRFRAGIELTQIDVTVLDANRRPVHGLRLDEFELFEDGAPKTIEAFAEINVPDAEGGASWRREIASDVRSNSAEDGRVIVFLLDEAMTNAYDSDMLIPAVKRITNEVIDQLGPNDVAAVLFTWDNKRQAQDFTTDRALLKAAVAKFQPRQFVFGRAAGGVDMSYNWSRNSSGVTGSVLKYLTDSPGRRKTMIYVSPAMLMRPTWPWNGGGPSVEELYLLNTFEMAIKAGVTVYGISPTGLRSLAKGEPPQTDARAAQFGASPRSLAGETGGFMINTPAQFKEGVAQILRETGSYYLLGYKAATDFRTVGDSPTPGYRKLEIRVKREGLTVKGRSGFIPKKVEKPPKTPESPLHTALTGVLPKTDLPLRVVTAPFQIPGQRGATVLMVLGVEEPGTAERDKDRLDTRARLFTHHGDPKGSIDTSVDVNLPAGRSDSMNFEVLSKLPIEAGRFELRMSARSTRLERDGSVYSSLDVPDFTKAPVSLSGVLLTVATGSVAAPAGAFSSIVPVVPTTKRSFARSDRAGVFARVYQGGTKAPVPAKVTIRILDSLDQVVFERRDDYPPTRFDQNRAADVQLDLPLTAMTIGSYLLRIEVSISGPPAVRRDVRFTVH